MAYSLIVLFLLLHSEAARKLPNTLGIFVTQPGHLLTICRFPSQGKSALRERFGPWILIPEFRFPRLKFPPIENEAASFVFLFG